MVRREKRERRLRRNLMPTREGKKLRNLGTKKEKEGPDRAELKPNLVYWSTKSLINA